MRPVLTYLACLYLCFGIGFTLYALLGHADSRWWWVALFFLVVSAGIGVARRLRTTD